MLNHLRESPKDMSAMRRLEMALRVRRNSLYILKREHGLAYRTLLRLYDMDDLESIRGEGIHNEHFHCKAPRYGPG